jgi:hypothetical protein
MIGVFVGFSCIFLLESLIFKGLTARRLYKSFGVKGLMSFSNYTKGDNMREIMGAYIASAFMCDIPP